MRTLCALVLSVLAVTLLGCTTPYAPPLDVDPSLLATVFSLDKNVYIRKVDGIPTISSGFDSATVGEFSVELAPGKHELELSYYKWGAISRYAFHKIELVAEPGKVYDVHGEIEDRRYIRFWIEERK